MFEKIWKKRIKPRKTEGGLKSENKKDDFVSASCCGYSGKMDLIFANEAFIAPLMVYKTRKMIENEVIEKFNII